MLRNKNILIFLRKITKKHIKGVKDLEKELNKKFRIIILTDKKENISNSVKKDIYKIIRVNLSRIDLIEKELLPYKERIAAIISKFENTMPLYSRLITVFPYLKNPTPHSLMIASDKVEMRKAFKKYCPQHIPKFIIVKDAERKTITKIIKSISFPCVIKPASLSKSQLVINCYYKEELVKYLKLTIKKIKVLYKKNKVEHEPKILVEQLIEGSLYSIDAYVNSLGRIYYTPFIEIKTGKDIGHDDFFMYSQMTPSNLNKEEKDQAKAMVADGIHALGLKSCTAHAEFYKTKKSFKIVEIAARTGGFRDEILKDAFGLKHHMNDYLIKLGQKPDIKLKKKKYTAFLKFWPLKQGKLLSIKGFNKISTYPFVLRSKQLIKPGEKVGFSKFGHGYICSFNIAASSRSELLGYRKKIESILEFKIK